MTLPLRAELVHAYPEIEQSLGYVNKLITQNFAGKDEELFKVFLAEFECENTTQLLEKVFWIVSEQIDFSNLNLTDIENLDLFQIMKKVAEQMQFKSNLDLDTEQGQHFKETAQTFLYDALHNLAFPLLALENPKAAVSAKNMIKRTLASIETEEQVDVTKVYEVLDIENLPTAFSMELLKKFGGRIPGHEIINAIAITDTPDNNYPILHCRLNTEQMIYLCYVLQHDYGLVKNWRRLFDLLSSNGKKYNNVIVCNGKIGLLVSVLQVLHERRTIAGDRYLYKSKGKGVCEFFQQFLVDPKTDQLFRRDLRKNKVGKHRTTADQILNDLLSPNRQQIINERANEIIKEESK